MVQCLVVLVVSMVMYAASYVVDHIIKVKEEMRDKEQGILARRAYANRKVHGYRRSKVVFTRVPLPSPHTRPIQYPKTGDNTPTKPLEIYPRSEVV